MTAPSLPASSSSSALDAPRLEQNAPASLATAPKTPAGGLPGPPRHSGQGGLRASFRAAAAGVLRAIATQRNMRIHMVSALMVMIVGMALPLDLATRVALLFAVSLVLFAEIVNSGLEALVDLYVKDFHRLALLAKDAAAGGVLVLAFTTVVVLCEILWTQWHVVTENLDAVWRSVLFGVPAVLLEALGLFVMRPRGAFAVVRLLLVLGLLAPLVVKATDPLFAAVALVLVFTTAYARRAFPQRQGRGAPRKA